MSLLTALTLNLSKAHALLRELLNDRSTQGATLAEIETRMHPTIKTATRPMIQTEALAWWNQPRQYSPNLTAR
jgi:hypothetical protein